MPEAARLTELLVGIARGEDSARGEALPLVYEELRRIAARYMARERPNHTLQPTALVHEAYLRLLDQNRLDWKNRAQFVGLAAKMMRRILLNYARDRMADKRGGGAAHVSLTVAADVFASSELDLLALNDALERLATLDPRKERVVELKFFGGLTTDEIGEVLQLSSATIEREWKFARAWLYDALCADADGH